MILYKKNLLKVLVSFFVLFGFSIYSWAECQLSSTWEPWEPYQFLSKADKVTGLDNDLVNAIAKSAGCSVSFVKRPWKRSLIEVKEGDSDIAPGASFSKERAQYAYFSDTYRSETMSLFVLKENLTKYSFTNMDELMASDVDIGVVRGYHYGEHFKVARENANTTAKIQETSADENNIKKLLKRRIDFAIVDPYSGIHLLKQLGAANKVSIHPMTVNSDNIYIMLSKKSVSQETVQKLNEGLKSIRASGEYQEIINNYLN